MFKVLGKLSWFEWLGLGCVITALVFFAWFFINHGRMEEREKQLNERVGGLSTALEIKQEQAVINDELVSSFASQRELKVEVQLQEKIKDLDDYVNTRDRVKAVAPVQEPRHVTPSRPQPHPTPTPAVRTTLVVDPPDPAAIGVLAAGMHRTYCRAYADPARCTAAGAASGLPPQTPTH